MNGAGKYDDLATYVREQAEAEGVFVAVIRGNKGGGFSVQASGEILAALPKILEAMATEIRIVAEM